MSTRTSARTLRASLAPAAAPARAAVAVALGAGLLGLAGAASASASAPASTAVTAAADGACADGTGITVVVDKTDLGGEVEVGCAPTAATGTEALQAAGFTDTRDAATMICAVDDLPDPCPTEFTGSFWAYWTAAPDGEWEQAMVGSDQAEPTPGGVEGWRYNDGTEAPGVAPAEAVAQAAGTGEDAAEDSAADDGASVDDGTSVTTTEQEPAQDGGLSPAVVAGIGLVVVLGVAALVVARRRSPHGPAGQD